MEERKRGYQGRRLAGATPRQEPERRGSRTRQAEDKARRDTIIMHKLKWYISTKII